ncbi:MAG: serine hydrolase, partial [Firmicutes bacterium]|nr:serine hydrolase [Bacillota bacterium]
MNLSATVQASLAKVSGQPGHVGFCYRDLTDGTTAGFQEHEPIVAASVIKIPVLVEFFEQMNEGTLFPD